MKMYFQLQLKAKWHDRQPDILTLNTLLTLLSNLHPSCICNDYWFYLDSKNWHHKFETQLLSQPSPKKTNRIFHALEEDSGVFGTPKYP